ncbi:MAG: response regulator [Deltaproteobacteria bacterium]|nr:response regulator [Deltaproteobacteria bacterium]MBW2001641.1 response regulator [Deltaproteobacteria bacterium]
MKILVVDDEDIVLESCQAVFELEGFEVMLVPSADKAIEAMKNDNFTLLLIDVKMPKHDGMYLMEKIKEQWPDIPIIVMSGYYTTETIKEAFEMGAAKFIAKPFEPDELVKTVRQIIKKEKGHGKKASLSN